MPDADVSPPENENPQQGAVDPAAPKAPAAHDDGAARRSQPAQNRQATDPPDRPAPPPVEDPPKTDLEEELRQLHDRFLRAQAELENYRKRARRELEAERRYSSLPLLRDLLAVVDNLQRAIEAAEQHDNAAGLLEGVHLVAAQLQSVLEQHHCRPIEAAGQPFDPNLHEAVAHEPSDEHPPGQVTGVARVGYQLHDRVIRPSQVRVSSGSLQPDQPTD